MVEQPITLRLLGMFYAAVNTETLQLGSTKIIALLAYLADHDQPFTRNHIMTLLWPESHPDAAAKNLRNLLWSIRKTCPNDIIKTDGEYINLTPTVWVDVDAFENLVGSVVTPQDEQDILALYRGEFLENLGITNMPEYETWLIAERERYQKLFLHALNTLIEQRHHNKAWEQVIRLGDMALHYDRLQEVVHRNIMEAYTYLGRRSDALRQYETLSDTLQQELMVQPLPETRNLYESIVQGHFPLQEAQAYLVSTNSLRRARELAHQFRDGTTSLDQSVRMVGRSQEYGQMIECYYRAASEGFQAVFVRGVEGIGKTRLVEEFLKFVESNQGMAIRTRATQTNQDLSYQVMVDLLQDPLSENPDFLKQIDDVWLVELTRLLPEIHNHVRHLPDQPTTLETRLFEAATRYVQALIAPETNLVMFIDDFQWIDPPSVSMLHYMCNRFIKDKLPITLVLTIQQTYIGHINDAHYSPEIAQHLLGLGKALPTTRIAVESIRADDTQRLLQTLQAENAASIQALGESIYEETQGHPHSIIELLKYLIDNKWLILHINGGPKIDFGEIDEPVLQAIETFRSPKIEVSTDYAWAQLSETAQLMLMAASIIEDPIRFEQMLARANVSEELGLNALDEILSRQLLQETADDGYIFPHRTIRKVIYAKVSQARRRLWHIHKDIG